MICTLAGMYDANKTNWMVKKNQISLVNQWRQANELISRAGTKSPPKSGPDFQCGLYMLVNPPKRGFPRTLWLLSQATAKMHSNTSSYRIIKCKNYSIWPFPHFVLSFVHYLAMTPSFDTHVPSSLCIFLYLSAPSLSSHSQNAQRHPCTHSPVFPLSPTPNALTV